MLRPIISTFILLFAFKCICHAKWVKTNGPPGERVYSLEPIGSDLFAGTDSGLFRYSGQDTIWTEIAALKNTNVMSLAKNGTELLAGTHGKGVYISSDDGKSWAQINNGLTNHFVESVFINDQFLFAGTYYRGIFRSSDRGKSWSKVNNGIPDTNRIRCFAFSGKNLYVGTDFGVFRSTENGDEWTPKNIGLMDEPIITSLAVKGGTILAGELYNGVFHSLDDDSPWLKTSSGLKGSIYSLAVVGSNLFTGTDEGMYWSTNSGETWAAFNTGSAYNYVLCVAASSTHLFIGTKYGGVWRLPISEIATSISPSKPPSVKSGFAEPLYGLINQGTRIGINIQHQGLVDLSIYNSKGRKVSTLLHSELAPGMQQIPLGNARLPEGLYFLRLQADGFAGIRRILIRN